MSKIVKITLVSLVAIIYAIIGARAASAEVASWYGNRFHGRLTASGERFNQYAMTAAHRKLPFGTMVKVTNRKTGKSVTVKINDRGPFHGNRSIDLSKGAAKAIGCDGICNVDIKVVKRGDGKRHKHGGRKRTANQGSKEATLAENIANHDKITPKQKKIYRVTTDEQGFAIPQVIDKIETLKITEKRTIKPIAKSKPKTRKQLIDEKRKEIYLKKHTMRNGRVKGGIVAKIR